MVVSLLLITNPRSIVPKMCGLHEIERKIQLKQAFEKEKIVLMIQELQGMFNNVQDLRERIELFEKKYVELMASPEYREKLRTLKEELGLMEAPSSREQTVPSVIERLTGKGKFYNALAVQLLEVAGRKAKDSGGILTLAEVTLMINKEQSGNFSQLGDIIKAIGILQDAGLIPGIRELPSGVKIVEFLPVEVSDDSNTVLDLAVQKGWVTVEEIMLKANWPTERAERALENLEKLGVARTDVSYAKGTRWYFPGLTRSDANKKRQI
jgi:hypothetical protein